MKIDKYIITTVIFITIITVVGIATIWENKGKFWDMVKSGDVINKANSIYSDNVAFSEEFVDLWSATQVVSETQFYEDAEYGVIVKDNTGNLYFPIDEVDVTNQADNVIKLANKVSDNDMQFLYVQAPNKVLNGYTEEIVYEYNFANKNADNLLKILEESQIDTLDLRKLIKEDKLDKDSLFYKTDHHWTTDTAFWAYTKIIDCLNEKYGLQIDNDYFYRNLDNYDITKIEDCFLGSLGRRVGKAISGLDDYTFITPKFNTDYKLYNGVVSTNDAIFSGNFTKAIVKEKILNSNEVTDNKHATYFEWDYGDLIVKNTLIENGKKILLIKDSYALPVAAFLSTCVEEVRMVDIRDTPAADLKSILENEKFDAVILMYNTEAVDISTMFEFKL